MSGINEHITIPKNVATKDDQDFHFLRQKGIEYIESIGGKLWTDLNTHDPGVTFLEMLSYAITDLGMRIEMPIEDLLSGQTPGSGISSQFYKASEVFPSKSVTALDYRKLFIDCKDANFDGVKNCWLTKHNKTVFVDCQQDLLSYNRLDFTSTPQQYRKEFELNGLYDLLVDFDEILDDSEIQTLTEVIRAKYHANRNLCEDLVNIKKVDDQDIAICTNIEVYPDADEEFVHAKICRAIDEYFSPSIRFYSVKEMLDMGYTTDEIFEGPLLDHGFIDSKELLAADLRTEVRLSDIIRVIMGIDGVKQIKEISIRLCDEESNENNPDQNDWVICLKPGHKPKLCKEKTFNYWKGLLPLNLNETQVTNYKDQLEQEADSLRLKASLNRTLDLPQGEYSDPDSYTTIQNDFPDTYGIGQEGLSGRATTERKSQAKQLKAYLTFFDQILASYFKHLGQVKDILSVSGTNTKTFFTQAIDDIKGFDELINNYPQNNDEELTELLFEQQDNNFERRNQVLDHLLARFAENLSEYTFLMKSLYGTAADELVMSNKEAFLADYISASAQKACAFNYNKQPLANLWNTDNISGVQKRVSRLMGIKNYNRRDLSSSFIEIYEVTGSPGTFEWKVEGLTGNTLLISAITHNSYSEARESLYFSILQIIQTSEKQIEEAFEGIISDGLVIGHLQIIKPTTSTFTIAVINEEFLPSEPEYITAAEVNTFASVGLLETGLIDLIDFMKNDFTEEGIFLVEHIILRPDVTGQTGTMADFLPICTENCESCDPIDPYSYRVSIVIPGYTFRFIDPDFRLYMENVIKKELPAHVLAKICWVGYRQGEVTDAENDLLCFEIAWQDYLDSKKDLEQEVNLPLHPNLKQPQPQPELDQLKLAMGKLNTLYPSGKLIDCDDDSNEMEGGIILGRTNLGSL